MRLSIYTMRKTIYEGETPRVTLPTVMGQVTVLDNHEPYVTLLEPGKLHYVSVSQEGPHRIEKEESIDITGGFLEVRVNNEVRILADA